MFQSAIADGSSQHHGGHNRKSHNRSNTNGVCFNLLLLFRINVDFTLTNFINNNWFHSIYNFKVI